MRHRKTKMIRENRRVKRSLPIFEDINDISAYDDKGLYKGKEKKSPLKRKSISAKESRMLRKIKSVLEEYDQVNCPSRITRRR